MSPETAEWLDGPGLAAWLGERIPLDGLAAHHESMYRAILRWRNGDQACVYTVDDLLVRLGIHLSEVPEELFVSTTRRRAYPLSEQTRTEALRLYTEGVGPGEIGRRLGIGSGTVSGWARRANLPMQAPWKSRTA